MALTKIGSESLGSSFKQVCLADSSSIVEVVLLWKLFSFLLILMSVCRSIYIYIYIYICGDLESVFQKLPAISTEE